MKRIWMLSVAALLAACSGGPGNGDVEKALAVYFKEATGTTMTFEGLKVGECVRGAVLATRAVSPEVCAISWALALSNSSLPARSLSTRSMALGLL